MISDIAKRCYENINSGCCVDSIEHQADRDREFIQQAIDEATVELKAENEELQEKLNQSEKHNRNVGAANISQQDWNWKLTAENEELKKELKVLIYHIEGYSGERYRGRRFDE